MRNKSLLIIYGISVVILACGIRPDAMGLSISPLHSFFSLSFCCICFALFLFREKKTTRKQQITEESSNKRKNIPKSSKGIVKYTGKLGLTRLLKQLNKTKRVNSIWVSKPGYDKEYSHLIFQWHHAIIDSLQRGVEIEQVFASNMIETTTVLMNSIAAKCKGYKYSKPRILQETTPPCINFSILHLEDNTKELWFGWMNKPSKKEGDNCFRSKDPILIKYFENWFSDLYSQSKQLRISSIDF